MSPEKQRIIIAEACGWVRAESLTKPCAMHFRVDKDDQIWTRVAVQVPDYLNDLNAMHEAEKVLTHNLHGLKYHTELELVMRDDPFLWRATASQRAEAFLRTIGKWEEQ